MVQRRKARLRRCDNCRVWESYFMSSHRPAEDRPPETNHSPHVIYLWLRLSHYQVITTPLPRALRPPRCHGATPSGLEQCPRVWRAHSRRHTLSLRYTTYVCLCRSAYRRALTLASTKCAHARTHTSAVYVCMFIYMYIYNYVYVHTYIHA